jgi:ribosome-associated protein
LTDIDNTDDDKTDSDKTDSDKTDSDKTDSDNTNHRRVGTTRHSGATAERADARRLAIEAARAADDKGARDVIILEVADVLVVADFFVIASGANDRQVKAVVEEIERRVADAELGKPLRVEGLDDRKWVLLDYGDAVVHVFLQEVREYYQLERLWSDVPRVDWAPTTVRS